MTIKKEILIVEDEERLRETWKHIFKSHGISVYIAANGIEAEELIKSFPIKIIVTDIQMPIADGYYVLNYIKSNDLEIKTIVCTGQINDKSMSEFNIEKIIYKPFNMIKEVKYIINLMDQIES